MEQDLLGAYPLAYTPFDDLDTLFESFQKPSFQKLSNRKKFDQVNRTLLKKIEEANEPCFLLAASLDFIDRVNREKLLREPLTMTQWEFWLNHFSQLSDDENLNIRCKIVGKKLPRSVYQAFFPIGMGKMFAGSHFVAAHLSPDVDTTIASFWGWVDAFGCRVASGTHQWSLPGIAPEDYSKHLFYTLFGSQVFDLLVRKTPNLTLTALDLVTNKEILKAHAFSQSHSIALGRPVIVVDEAGHFVGDWRPQDAEPVRQTTSYFQRLVRWLENAIHFKFIRALSEEKVAPDLIRTSLMAAFDMTLGESEPVLELSEKQKRELDSLLKNVLELATGLQATFLELAKSLETKAGAPIDALLKSVSYFDASKNRANVFKQLDKIFCDLDHAIQCARSWIDRFDVLIAIKHKVLDLAAPYVTLNSDVEEIRTKMANFEYLPVLIPEERGASFPVGVVFAKDLKRQNLGTVSLRDFSSENETKMASYLEIISIIDHHKSDIATSSASMIAVADVQSANTLVAELLLKINDAYSTQGIEERTIDLAIDKANCTLPELSRLIDIKMNYRHAGSYFIHPQREFAEYLLLLCAILDDTDLLTKVSQRDLECVVKLLNRMRSLTSKSVQEILSLDDISQNADFIKLARQRILQNAALYSLYKKSHAFKEQEVTRNLTTLNIFGDTKEQNGCARVGQIKIFSSNLTLFEETKPKLLQEWLSSSKQVFDTRREIDLHMMMTSTLLSADEVYQAKSKKWTHKDELWIYIPMTQSSIEHLVYFLNSFQAMSIIQNSQIEVDLLGSNAQILEQIFIQNFPKASRHINNSGMPVTIIRYKAGLLNSRKAYITPNLPRAIF